MLATRVVVCAVLAVPVGWFAGILAERVPDGRPLLDPATPVRLGGRPGAMLATVVALFVAAAVRFADEPIGVLAGYLLLFAVLVTVSAIDIERYRLPDVIVLPALVVSTTLVIVVSAVHDDPLAPRYALTGAAVYFGSLLVAHLIYPRGMGFGDVKLAALMGLYVGWLAAGYGAAVVLVLWAMLIGFVAGSVAGVVLLVVRRASRPIPFGPFLAAGAIVTVLASTALAP